ncbi:MAG: hydroxyacylglutathione hydrolase [Cyanobacteriota bacterium]
MSLAGSLPGSLAGSLAARAVALLPVLSDNYVMVLHDDHQAVVVDPAVAAPVAAWLDARQLELVAVLQTHHHSDHIGGTVELLRRWPNARVYAAAADLQRIPFQSDSVGDGDQFTLLGRSVEVLAVPGHTRAHLAYYLPGGSGCHPELFCGDTLFGGGCGRLFEGTPAQMHDSLQRLAALPADTRVWCAHEYTETNLRWAHSCLPEDRPIVERLAAVAQQRAAGRPTVPSSIGLERATNLFVRSGSVAELADLRASRNHWKG